MWSMFANSGHCQQANRYSFCVGSNPYVTLWNRIVATCSAALLKGQTSMMSNGNGTSSKLRYSFLLAAAFLSLSLVAGCSQSTDSDAQLSVPTLEYTGGIRPLGVENELVRIETFDDEACPVVAGDPEGLLVSPPGTWVQASPLELVTPGGRIPAGSTFLSIPLERIPEGFDCGGKHWDVAYWLRDYGGETSPQS